MKIPNWKKNRRSQFMWIRPVISLPKRWPILYSNVAPDDPCVGEWDVDFSENFKRF